MNTDARAVAVVAAVVIAIGAVPMYAGGSRIYEHIAYAGAGSAASADVVAAERLWLRELASPFPKRSIWELTYEFKTAQGAVVRSSGIYTQSTAITAPEPGRKLRVLYLPDDPGTNYLEDDYKLLHAAWYVGLGLFLWLVAGAFVWWEIRQARRPA